jgi:RNA polymerase sigma-70 factor (ECF subfamily)
MIGEEFAGVLQRAQGGSEEAFERLWRDLNPVLLRYLSLSGEPAEDVAAETWASVVKALRRFRGDEGAWRAWVFTTARRRAVDAARRRARQSMAPRDWTAAVRWASWTAWCAGAAETDEPMARDCADDALELLDTQAAVRLVASLPPLQAEVVMLRVVVGLPVEDVAAMVGRSTGAVRVAAHRGLRQLARTLAHDDAQPGSSPGVETAGVTTLRPAALWE